MISKMESPDEELTVPRGSKGLFVRVSSICLGSDDCSGPTDMSLGTR